MNKLNNNGSMNSGVKSNEAGGVNGNQQYHNAFWDGVSMVYWYEDTRDIDAQIEAARYPDPMDRVMARYDEAGKGKLPSDAELERLGVDRSQLAYALRSGMTATKFTRALKHGFDVTAFNDREGGLPMDTLLDYFLMGARERKRLSAVNRALRALHDEMV